MFSFELAIELPENTDINKYSIKLENDKQQPYGPIYSLRLVELEILKTYIEIYLETGFIQIFKTPAGVLILFNKKPESSFHLCVDY